MRGKSLLMAAMLCAATSIALGGPVYKWVDTQGRYHYGDQPLPGWTRVDVKPIGGGATEPEPTPTPAPVDDAPAGEDPVKAVNDAAASARLRADECKRRREQLETYRNAPRIIERDEKGQEREYNEAQRLQLLEQTQRQVTELCRDPSG
ncbi:DUF4124 domain-containing protein [Sinimarinibacterium sp. CAU 1509]|uniref:DUF4124 domain-containing protein n=1 Tax=Sinimarinibacterium sp. CAU 1509 TaxID=2562283 RepID=UPI0010AD1EE6|nr:DUF4124 domain-containing protein [Sinimarinibacterium sp. CAU 1509]TJY58382.1 DUF4124 domain-containing protein [Sinimarinibacterium sp. CAU 1509]